MTDLPGLNFQLGEDIDALRDAVRDLNDPKLRTAVVNELVTMTEQRREVHDFDAMLAGVFGT